MGAVRRRKPARAPVVAALAAAGLLCALPCSAATGRADAPPRGDAPGEALALLMSTTYRTPPARAAARQRPVPAPAAASDSPLALAPSLQLARAPVVPGRAARVAQAPAAAPAGPAAAAASLDLAQAYRIALDNDAAIRAVRAATAATRERLPQARAQLLPNISATVNRFDNHLDTTGPGTGGAIVTSRDRYYSGTRTLLVRQPLYRPAQLADLRQARAEVAQAEATLQQEVQSLAVRVSTAYMQALAAHDQLALVLAQARAFNTQLEAARRRFEGGSGTRTDVDEARARLDLSVAQELEARQNLDFTRRQLQILLDVPVGELGELDAQKMPLAAPPGAVEQWTRAAEDSSPEIRALQAQVEVARSQLEKARAGHLPTLDAVGQWSVSDSDQVTRLNSRYDQKSVGVQLNVPLYAGGYVSSQVRQAAAELARAQELLESGRRDLGLRVHREYRGVGEGAARVRALEQAVRSARTVVESTRRSHEAGSRTVVDVLNAEEQHAAAERDLADARYLYVLSRIRLRALAGQADAALIEEANAWLRR